MSTGSKSFCLRLEPCERAYARSCVHHAGHAARLTLGTAPEPWCTPRLLLRGGSSAFCATDNVRVFYPSSYPQVWPIPARQLEVSAIAATTVQVYSVNSFKLAGSLVVVMLYSCAGPALAAATILTSVGYTKNTRKLTTRSYCLLVKQTYGSTLQKDAILLSTLGT
jgi:hypothetical protein